jgi:hypothetical protein
MQQIILSNGIFGPALRVDQYLKTSSKLSKLKKGYVQTLLCLRGYCQYDQHFHFFHGGMNSLQVHGLKGWLGSVMACKKAGKLNEPCLELLP